MAELLRALGWQARPAHCLRLVAILGATTALALIASIAVAEAGAASILLVQASLWAGWLAWLGIVFPRNGQRDLESPGDLMYRRAFFREILIGISIAFSQFLRPLATGLIHGGAGVRPASALAMGVPLLACGAVLIAVGVSTLGVARTLFVHEYVRQEREVVGRSIYRYIRHPLFLGGSLASLGLAICTDTRVAIELGLLNVLVCPLYVNLEDRRCIAVLGRAYADYSEEVGGIVPRRRSLIRRPAQLRDAAGSIEPNAGRAQVSKR